MRRLVGGQHPGSEQLGKRVRQLSTGPSTMLAARVSACSDRRQAPVRSWPRLRLGPTRCLDRSHELPLGHVLGVGDDQPVPYRVVERCTCRSRTLASGGQGPELPARMRPGGPRRPPASATARSLLSDALLPSAVARAATCTASACRRLHHLPRCASADKHQDHLAQPLQQVSALRRDAALRTAPLAPLDVERLRPGRLRV